jgi:streptogramin lyase
MAVDSQGRLIVADYGNCRIQIFHPDGVAERAWYLDAILPLSHTPNDVALDAQDNVYVADAWRRAIRVYTEAGTPLRTFDYGYDFGVVTSLDVEGRYVYALDGEAHQVRIFDLMGQPPPLYPPRYIDVPYPGDERDVTVDKEGNIYILSGHNAKVTKYNWRGERLTEWGAPGSAAGEFDEPMAIEADTDGHVYVSERANVRIQKFDNTGTPLCLWGSFGGAPGQFRYLSGLAAGAGELLYVSQYWDTFGEPGLLAFAPTVSVTPTTWSQMKEKYR